MIDSTLIFSNEQSFASVEEGDTPSTNIIDTVGGNIGSSGQMQLVVSVDLSFTAGTVDPQMNIVLQDSADDSSWNDVFMSRQLDCVVDLAVTGQQGGASTTDAAQSGAIVWKQALPKVPELKRYVRVCYRIVAASGHIGVGKLSAYLEGIQ